MSEGEAKSSASASVPKEAEAEVVNDVNDVVVGVIVDSMKKNGGLYKLGIEFLKDNAKELIDENDKNPLLDLLPRLMEWVEKIGMGGKVDGPQKKKLVLRLMNWIVDNSEELGLAKVSEHSEKLKDFMSEVAPSLIDLVIAASRGKLNINAVVETAAGCMSLCCWAPNVEGL